MIEILAILYLYMFVYNSALIIFFIVLFQFSQFELRTMSNLNNMFLTPFLLSAIAISILSMAGVPPILGFFSNLLILLTIVNSSLSLFSFFFLILLLVSLYFYMLNISFIYANSGDALEIPHWRSTQIAPSQLGILTGFAINLLFGFCFFDDILMAFSWLLA